MEIDISRIGDVVVLRMAGEFRTRSDIAAVFWAHLQNSVSRFVLNFDKVRTINSIGFQTLLELQRLAEASGGGVRICGLSDELRKTFRTTQMEEVFSIMQDEESALVDFLGILPVKGSSTSSGRYVN